MLSSYMPRKTKRAQILEGSCSLGQSQWQLPKMQLLLSSHLWVKILKFLQHTWQEEQSLKVPFQFVFATESLHRPKGEAGHWLLLVTVAIQGQVTQKNSAKTTSEWLVSERREKNKQGKEKLNSDVLVLRSKEFQNIATFLFFYLKFFLYYENILSWSPAFQL